ncbi:sushi, von Willebrand factor type A, EGF and pentraxin domain-containing protein 1-like isoform X1 [Haliotis rufescens]|uniref:sushi, von Willebrand factor type A, EGF and pentraxin domain-containing protein 1-like isoform X1 n=1 Tax=Haliotis rufescens TaxID=6454 RepID=UPI00201E865F|nr:sushi, von Willebrand factor type A, EGF and pentraxin domain-containing protein 1-like isoform X1 [Haliotis rufescens]
MGGDPLLLSRLVWVGFLCGQCRSLGLECDGCEVLQSRKLDIVPMFVAKVSVFQQCCNLCASMEGCGAVNYNVNTRHCELLHVASKGGNVTNSASYIYGIFKQKRGQTEKNLCRTRPCKANQICVMTSSNDDHICCEGGTCSNPPAVNRMKAEMDFVTLTTGQASYSCDTGYQPQGTSGISECTDGSGWSQVTLVCQGVNCGRPPPQSNRNVTSVTSTLYLDQVSYSCDVGYYRTDGEGTSVCQEDGVWSVPTLQCQVVDCGTPADIPEMVASAEETIYMSVTNYTCSPGLEPVNGTGVSECHADGVWSRPTLTCTKKDCGHPPPQSNQNVTSVTSTLYLDQVSYSCDVGYNRTDGEGTSVCQEDGAWSVPTLQCQVVECGAPPDRDGMEKGGANSTVYRSQMTYSCSPGFDFVGGEGSSMCQANVSWGKPSLNCTRKDCQAPTLITHMTVNRTSTLYESEAEYTCSVGYNATGGHGRVMCQADGTWETPSITCEIVDCGSPPDTETMQSPRSGGTSYQTTAVYSCKTGFTQSGDGTSTCQADGTWSPPALQCQIVDCGDPAFSGAYSVNFSTTTYLSSASLECGLGYYPSNGGDIVVECQSDGSWSDPIPSCVAIPSWQLAGTGVSQSNQASLQCRDVRSSGPITCDVDEILAGCSTIATNTNIQYNYGQRVTTSISTGGVQCEGRTKYGSYPADALARCCKQRGLQCEYIQRNKCYKNFKILDCTLSCYENNSYCSLIHTNQSCAKQYSSSYGITGRKIICCTSPGLSCHVMSLQAGTGNNLTLTCGAGEVMTGCSGYIGNGMLGAIIEVINGVDSCVFKLGTSTVNELRGYAHCCRSG